MRSLLGKAGFALSLRDGPDRNAEGRMARLRIHACGVCGTDLHFLRGAGDWTPLGHEIAAEVVETGSEVTRVQVGDRVIVEDVTMCGACEACKSGRVDLCRSGLTLAGQSGMADFMTVHENMLNVFHGIDWVRASMVEPLAVAIRCVEALSLPPYGSLVIYGAGAIGLLCAAYAKRMGAGRVVLAARGAGRLRTKSAERAAIALGADEVAYMDEARWAESSERFDAAIVAAPPMLAGDALARVKYGGVVLACGITLGDGAVAEVDVNDMVMNKKSLLTSIAEPALNFPLSIRLIADGAVDVGQIITHRVRLDEADALRALYGSDSTAVKTIIVCAGAGT